MKTCNAIVQARMGSSRLPGKVMIKICDRPVLGHVIDRLKSCSLLNRIIVATTSEKKDDLINDFCQTEEIDIFRGSENDVLSRYEQAANLFPSDSILRITADCPLLDPKLIDKLIKEFHKSDVDYLSNVVPPRTFPKGLDAELLKAKVLKKISNAAVSSNHKEHVTLYILENQKKFKIESHSQSNDYSNLRWTLDTSEDLIFIKKVYESLYKKNPLFTSDDILKNFHPKLINQVI